MINHQTEQFNEHQEETKKEKLQKIKEILNGNFIVITIEGNKAIMNGSGLSIPEMVDILFSQWVAISEKNGVIIQCKRCWEKFEMLISTKK